tara:strand:+ start:1644 stop:1826 length:183 start_codon:yes stop_codon:yes gene_type:complete
MDMDMDMADMDMDMDMDAWHERMTRGSPVEEPENIIFFLLSVALHPQPVGTAHKTDRAKP